MFPKIHGNYAVFGEKPFPNLSFLSSAFIFFFFFFSEVFPGYGEVSNERFTKGKVLLTPLKTIKFKGREKGSRSEVG